MKSKRNAGEQFCVFAFDCAEPDWQYEPPAAGVGRDELPFEHGFLDAVPTWDAAFYTSTAPTHTERALLDRFGQWVSDYHGTYGAPRTLYAYSFLIPCLRDGEHGMCSDSIVAWLLDIKENYSVARVRIGWSNNDRYPDAAPAIRDMLRDLESDGIDIVVYPDISIV